MALIVVMEQIELVELMVCNFFTRNAEENIIEYCRKMMEFLKKKNIRINTFFLIEIITQANDRASVWPVR